MRDVEKYIEEGKQLCSVRNRMTIEDFTVIRDLPRCKEFGSCAFANEAFYFGVAVGLRQQKNHSVKRK